MKRKSDLGARRRTRTRPVPPGQHISEITIGPKGRKLFVVDNVIEAEKIQPLWEFFRNLPYRFTDADRFDTQQYRHLGYTFDQDPVTDHPVIGFFADVATELLRGKRLEVGRVKRAYVNFNLYGDVQFVHEDGDEWTAVAFVNEVWQDDWGGELIIYDEPANHLGHAVVPRPGRMAIFDGQLLHRGGIPSKICNEPRITLALKLAR
jgi:SM-20-related protein